METNDQKDSSEKVRVLVMRRKRGAIGLHEWVTVEVEPCPDPCEKVRTDLEAEWECTVVALATPENIERARRTPRY